MILFYINYYFKNKYWIAPFVFDPLQVEPSLGIIFCKPIAGHFGRDGSNFLYHYPFTVFKV